MHTSFRDLNCESRTAPSDTKRQKPAEGRYRLRSAMTKPTRKKILDAGKNGSTRRVRPRTRHLQLKTFTEGKLCHQTATVPHI